MACRCIAVAVRLNRSLTTIAQAPQPHGAWHLYFVVRTERPWIAQPQSHRVLPNQFLSSGMASIALTTVLTPPASCFDNSYTLFGGSVYEKDISIAFTECYPSGYHSLFTEAIPYSPGVCPASYTIATQSAYTGNAGATAAVCCPT